MAKRVSQRDIVMLKKGEGEVAEVAARVMTEVAADVAVVVARIGIGGDGATQEIETNIADGRAVQEAAIGSVGSAAAVEAEAVQKVQIVEVRVAEPPEMKSPTKVAVQALQDNEEMILRQRKAVQAQLINIWKEGN